MNIKLLAVGKTDNKQLQQLMDDYQKRLSFYIKFELEILPDIKNTKNFSESQQKEKVVLRVFEGPCLLKYSLIFYSTVEMGVMNEKLHSFNIKGIFILTC